MNKSLEQLFAEINRIIQSNSQTLNGQVFVRMDTPLELKLAEFDAALKAGVE